MSRRYVVSALVGMALIAMPIGAATAKTSHEGSNSARPSSRSHAAGAAVRSMGSTSTRGSFVSRDSSNALGTVRRGPSMSSFRPSFAPARTAAHPVWRSHVSPLVSTPARPRYRYAERGIFRAGYREPDRDDYRYGCDADGDNCGPNYYRQPAFERVHHYEPDADDYSYNQYPSGYSGGPDYRYSNVPAGGYLQRLIYERDMARIRYERALARGDRLAAKHLYRDLVSLDAQIARARGGWYGNAAPYPAAPWTTSGYQTYPNYGYNALTGANPGYGRYGYGNNAYPNYGYNALTGANPGYGQYGYGNNAYPNYGYDPRTGTNPAYGGYGYPQGSPGYSYGSPSGGLAPLLQQFLP